MKSTIHPKYNHDVKITCSCGNTFVTGSTKTAISVEVCSKCHPFYTGEHRFVDTKGRVEKFQKKQQTAKIYHTKLAYKKLKKGQKEEKEVKTLKELLAEG